MLHFFHKRKRFFFYLGLIILCTALLARDIEKRHPHTSPEKGVLGVFSYPLILTTLVVTTLENIWSGYLYLVNTEKNNKELRQRIDALVLENHQLQEHLFENQQLRALLDFKQQFSYPMLAAEIIGRDPSSWFRTIQVNRGTIAGVERGYGVISPQGVVGRVIETTPHSSKILLITDQNSSIDVLLTRSRVRGILEGRTDIACRVQYVGKTEDIQPGDTVITSGLNAIFPRGILVGSVATTGDEDQGFFKNINVSPAVDFSKLNAVLIVLRRPPDSNPNS